MFLIFFSLFLETFFFPWGFSLFLSFSIINPFSVDFCVWEKHKDLEFGQSDLGLRDCKCDKFAKSVNLLLLQNCQFQWEETRPDKRRNDGYSSHCVKGRTTSCYSKLAPGGELPDICFYCFGWKKMKWKRPRQNCQGFSPSIETRVSSL